MSGSSTSASAPFDETGQGGNGRSSDGVNVVGYLRTESGMGTAVRRYIRAIQALRLPHTLLDVSALSGNRAEDRTLSGFDHDGRYEVNLVCADVELHFAILSRLGDAFFRGKNNVGMWAWELPRFPERWYDRFVYYDEIWVGSSFIANSLAPVSPIPVVRLPPVLTPARRGSRDRGRRRLGVSPEETVYLFVFDFHSRIERKNPGAVIEAFRAAFAPSERARLVVKCVNGQFNSEALAALSTRAEGYPIDIHAGYWTSEEMRDLMAACDAYVSLHRSEGIGLPITDAMALGKPVIATGWSGNMDFMNAANSYPVRYELVAIEESAGQYRAGEVWAEPSIEHAAQVMRFVLDNREEAGARGEAAKRDIETSYSEDAVASVIGQRLAVLTNRPRISALKCELEAGMTDARTLLDAYQDVAEFVPSKFLRYRQTIDRIRELVRNTLPPDAVVAVVGKGDDELLQLDDRRGWHFPRAEDGAYAGHYPADSAWAIAHLEALRAKGAQFLLLPNTALWWLDHYAEFGRHLERNYRTVVRQEDACLIYALDGPDGTDGLAEPASELAELRKAIEEQKRQLTSLASQSEAMVRLEAGVRAALRLREDRLQRNNKELPVLIRGLETTLAAALEHGRQLAYRDVIRRIRAAANTALPPEATVLVVSRGDDELLHLGDARRGHHFPQADGGVYAGHHPANSAAAITHLEILRAGGAGFLLFPSTAFWWFEHYRDFRQHLESCYRRAWEDEHCVIYELSSPMQAVTSPTRGQGR
jgi:glycosyltransferase involved in cell wall biosynthesis